MHRVIWSCWFQGRDRAPFIVQKCLESWVSRNPNWDVRILDAGSVRKYLDLDDYVDLDAQEITAASLSDIIRIQLLHEYGGVWADATTYCSRPIDDWLPRYMPRGFFAFSDPGPGLLLSSWFLARDAKDEIVGKWAARTREYWFGRRRADNYFWFHSLFGDLVGSDSQVAAAWSATPRIKADGPHRLQWAAAADARALDEQLDEAPPVFKLSHRMDAAAWAEKTPIGRLLRSHVAPAQGPEPLPRGVERPVAFAGLKTTTENLGDHIQILAAERLLKRADVSIEQRIDRDHEIMSAPGLAERPGKTGIVLNGWFKTNPVEWPPSPRLTPMYLGFHIRPFQSPSLIGAQAIEHYQAHAPIGCRDEYTLELLASLGVAGFVSNCLSLALPRRLPDPDRQVDLFVASRDERLLDLLPAELGEPRFVSHYSGDLDFESNLKRAADLLETYRDRARLVVTSLLHCALPCLAMGIPVVVFYPFQQEAFMRASDRERFSSLRRLVRVYDASEVGQVNWAGQAVDLAQVKLANVDAFFEKARLWDLPPPRPIGPIAPPGILPPP